MCFCCTSPAQHNSISQMSWLFQFSNNIFIFLEHQSPAFQREKPSDQAVSHMFNISDLGPERYWSQWQRVTQNFASHLADNFQSLMGKPGEAYFTRLLRDYFTRNMWCLADSVIKPVICDSTCWWQVEKFSSKYHHNKRFFASSTNQLE